jgi:Pilus formation protein N terminal region
MKQFSRMSLGTAMLLLTGAGLGPRVAVAQNGQIASPPSIARSKVLMESEPLPPQILVVADYSARMRVMLHCNRLVRTRGNVARTFVADARIAEIVQFRPDEFVLIGLETGRTTVTLWFEDSPEPLIYLVDVVLAPAGTSRGFTQNPDRDEAAQVGSYGNRRKQESRTAANRQRPSNTVKPAAVDTHLPPANLALQRQPTGMPLRGRYDGHTPWPKSDRKMPGGAVPIGPDAVLAGRAGGPR